jgi:hypothetical protein
MQHGLGFINAILTMAVIAVILVWGVTALTNGDPFWFAKRFDAKAEELVIYWEGQQMTLTPNDPDYDDIMAAFAKAIAKPVAFEYEVGFSEENINLYKEQYKLLEVKFKDVVQLHTRYPFNDANTYLVPLNMTHARYRRIYSFPGLLPYTSGPVNVQQSAFEQLFAAVEKAVN